MKKDQPLVSVIMPAFNAAYYIGQSISSILAQSYHHLELLIIDDASTDNTLKIVQHYQAQDQRIKIIRHDRNLGAGATRQTGITNARGEYILWQDADDYSSPDRLQILLAVLQPTKKLSALSAVGSGFYIRRGRDIKLGKTPIALAKLAAKKHGDRQPHSDPVGIHFPTLLVRADAYQRAPYRPFAQGEDADWCYRLLEKNGVIKNLPQPLYYYRKHGHGLTKNHFQKFVCGMMVRLAHELRQKNLPDPFDNLPNITAKDFRLLYAKPAYPAIKKNISNEINWFLLENTRAMLTRPWFFYKYIYAIGRFFVFAGVRHFFTTARVFVTRWAINILPYIFGRKVIF
ncbi:MAG: glycosyltransferase family 2 protein [Hydrotalea sp.]|nr:glycosyltransferase family 2 protein [Hydrotalea sp.]